MKKKLHCPYCGSKLHEIFYENRNRLFCDSCQYPVYENPVPATCMIVTDDRQNVLLVKRSVDPQKGLWCLPGGFIELGESPENAALRELYEETGLKGKIRKLLGVITNPNKLYDTVLLVGYLVTEYSGSLIAGDDASEIGFFSHYNLPEIAFESHKKFISEFYLKSPGSI